MILVCCLAGKYTLLPRLNWVTLPISKFIGAPLSYKLEIFQGVKPMLTLIIALLVALAGYSIFATLAILWDEPPEW